MSSSKKSTYAPLTASRPAIVNSSRDFMKPILLRVLPLLALEDLRINLLTVDYAMVVYTLVLRRRELTCQILGLCCRFCWQITDLAGHFETIVLSD